LYRAHAVVTLTPSPRKSVELIPGGGVILAEPLYHAPCVVSFCLAFPYNYTMRYSTIISNLVVIAALLLTSFGWTPTNHTSSTLDEADSRPPGVASPLADDPFAQRISETQRTANTVASVHAPGRDLVAITQRLKIKDGQPIPRVVNATTPDYPAGTKHQFYLADIGNHGYAQITATLQVVTEHAYWYVKDGFGVNLQRLQASANHFETHIYPTNRRVFGPEASPGVDNDPRITVLIAPIAGVGGYFSSADAYPRAVNPYSNQRDMIYISDVPLGKVGDPENYFEATLAHEFQHMIEWNVNQDRDIWVDEGCSEVAMFLNGYDVGGSDYAFTSNPDTQLNTWSDSGNATAHYGASYLFLRYLMDKYGGEQFISSLLKQPGLGVDAIDTAIKAVNNRAGFEGAFKDWTVANVLNDPAIFGGRYGYSEGGRANSRIITSYPATRSDTVRQHAADYYRLTGNLERATITFKGNSTIGVTAARPHSGRSYWYSNRRDAGDATLTRELDLTNTQKATLKFWTWYDIEDFYDYAYVEVSIDGGKTWDVLPGRRTTTEDPNGVGFGPGFTGKSGVSDSKSKSPSTWVEEAVDLSAYAGKKVLARFEYITDEGYNRPGLLIDDISVPEIGYSDNAEADNGWDAQGFVRIGSQMPQRWFVALVEKGSPNRVRQMFVTSLGTGAIELSGIGRGTSIREAILVIAPMAPKTTEPASYTITIKKK